MLGLTSPQEVDGQRVSGLKFADPVVLAVLTALLMFRFLPQGFRNGELRRDVLQLLARPASPTRPCSKKFSSKSKRQSKEMQWLLQIPKLDSSATSFKR